MAKETTTKPTTTTAATTPQQTTAAAPRSSQDAPATTTVTTPAEAAPAALTKEQKRALWDEYDKHDSAYRAAEAQVETIKATRATAIKAIVDGYGHTGPFKRSTEKGGAELTAARTKGGEAYTFRSKVEREAEEV